MEVRNFTHDKYLRALPQIIVSISLFYILIFFHFSSHSLPFILHSLKFYLLAIPLHSLDKSWVFLICNALLVILGVFPSSRLDDQNYQNTPEKEHIFLLESADQECENGHEFHACIWEEEEHGGGELGGDLGISQEEEVEEIIICITEGDKDDQESESSGFEYEDGIEEYGELEGERVILEKLSAEELNKKFDDFIIKMKEELRVEAQQQHLVSVTK